MQNKRTEKQLLPMFVLWVMGVALVCLLTGCAPTPTNAQIEAAIRAALAEEDSPPELVFSEMQVPMLYNGKAGAVLWTEDESIQRNFMVGYDRETNTFVVTHSTVSIRGEDGTFGLTTEVGTQEGQSDETR